MNACLDHPETDDGLTHAIAYGDQPWFVTYCGVHFRPAETDWDKKFDRSEPIAGWHGGTNPDGSLDWAGVTTMMGGDRKYTTCRVCLAVAKIPPNFSLHETVGQRDARRKALRLIDGGKLDSSPSLTEVKLTGIIVVALVALAILL